MLIEWGWTKKLLTMNPMEKHIIKMNTTLENMTYLVDNEKNMCQHKNCNH